MATWTSYKDMYQYIYMYSYYWGTLVVLVVTDINFEFDYTENLTEKYMYIHAPFYTPLLYSKTGVQGYTFES